MTQSERTAGWAGQRLHPASLVFSLGSAARRLLLPAIVIIFFSRGSNFEIWFALFFIPAALAALARYVSYRYRLDPDEMIVREGIITRNERHIPYARIQNIDLVQNPLHRLFGVAEVRLQTASGDKPEAVIRVLSLRAIERLRGRVFAGRRESAAAGPGDVPAAAVPAAPRDGEVLRLPSAELVLFGLISNRGMALVAAAVGLMWQFDLDEWWEELDSLPAWLGQAMTGAPDSSLGLTIMLGSALIVMALLAVRLLSIVWALIKFHGFTLSRQDSDLRVEYGLFTRVSATLPRDRIQKLTTRQQPLHRLCGRAAVQVETAGGGQQEEGSADRLWLAPLIRAERLEPLIAAALPDVEFDELDWQPIEARAGRRVFVRTAAPLALAGTVLILVAWLVPGLAAWRAWSALPLLAGLALAWNHARRYVRHARYAVSANAIVFRSGWWVRRMSVVRFAKIQAVSLEESPFDRRHGMAGVQVDTAGGGRIGHGIAIPYLDAVLARGIVQRLALEAGRISFRSVAPGQGARPR